MKKIFLIAGICLMATQSFSQSFYKNALVTTLDFGFDVYQVDYHYQLIGTNVIKDNKNGAASRSLVIGGEYGLANWFGIGLLLKPETYYTKYDTSTGSTPTAKSFDATLLLNFHVIRSAHFDLPLGLNLGFSHLQYNENDFGNNQIYGAGSYVDFHINPRFYFQRFGLNADVSFPIINYSNMTSNNSTFNQYVLADWKGSGVGFSIGFQYRFLNGK
ncbi:MAG: hypothetical protein ABI199_09215 [Bacteroidia bacterium]